VVSLLAYFVVSSAIWLGGIIFGFVWMTPNDAYECELSESTSAPWAGVLADIPK